jgi:hypothetical protein
MIPISGVFWKFSVEKVGFSTKTNVMIQFLHNLALFCVKTPYFAKFFCENIFKIKT